MIFQLVAYKQLAVYCAYQRGIADTLTLPRKIRPGVIRQIPRVVGRRYGCTQKQVKAIVKIGDDEGWKRSPTPTPPIARIVATLQRWLKDSQFEEKVRLNADLQRTTKTGM